METGAKKFDEEKLCDPVSLSMRVYELLFAQLKTKMLADLTSYSR